MKRIKVTIEPNGKPKVEAEGFVGGSCKEATKEILKALGATPDNSCNTDKPEIAMLDDNEDTVTLFG